MAKAGYPPQGAGYLSGNSGYPAASAGHYPNQGSRQGYTVGMTLHEVYDYDDGPSRNAFVRKVFLLLSIMLAATAGFVIMCMNIAPLNKFIVKSPWIMAVGAVIYLVSSLSIECCPIGRQVPWNYLCLILATIGMSLTTAGLSVRYKTFAVVISFLITLGLCIFLTCLACTSFDFTKYLLYAIVFGVVLMMFGFAFVMVTIFFKYIKTLHMILAGVTALFSCLMFVIEMQMILGGKTAELETDEYVCGALMLYTSIISIFKSILQLTSLFDD